MAANFFTFATNEATSGSLYYLGSIFGVVGPVLSGTGSGILGSMFTVFNTAVLAIGTMIITYTSGMSIILTAHEGEMLGKKFHSIWVPLRTVMGIAALVPSATGYSYLQIALMWFILQGVGAADTLWQNAVNYVSANGSLAPPAPGAAGASLQVGNIRGGLTKLFQGLACQAAQKATGIHTVGAGYMCTNPSPGPWCAAQDSDMLNVVGGPQVTGGVYNMGNPPGTCGSLTLTSSSPATTTALVNAYQLIVPLLGSVAAQLVTADDAYSTFVSPLSAGQTPPPTPPDVVQPFCATLSACTPAAVLGALGMQGGPTASTYKPVVDNVYFPYLNPTVGDFLTTQAIVFQSLMANAAAAAAASSTTSANPSLTDNGWIFAGAYFYELAKNNNSASTSATPAFGTSPPSTVSGQAQTTLLINEANELVAKIPVATASTPGSIHVGSCTIFGIIPLGSVCDDIVQGWMNALSGSSGGGSGNPVVSAQNFGSILLDTTEATLEIAIAAILLLTVAGVIVLGNGDPVAPLVIEILVLPVLFFFVAIFIGIGGTLAVYTPLIPFMLFAFGAINWLIATIETMIAAPIIAIGLLYPEGSHELWGKAEAAINLLLNIFLRPSLMIFGMITALLMSYVAMTLVNNSFIYTVDEMTGGGYGSAGGHTSIVEMIFFMIVYTSIFTTVISKCFELIHVIPDKILRWIGGGGESFGESADSVGKVGQGFQAGAEKTAGAAKGAGEGASAHRQADRKQQAAGAKHGVAGELGKQKGVEGSGIGGTNVGATKVGTMKPKGPGGGA